MIEWLVALTIAIPMMAFPIIAFSGFWTLVPLGVLAAAQTIVSVRQR